MSRDRSVAATAAAIESALRDEAARLIELARQIHDLNVAGSNPAGPAGTAPCRLLSAAQVAERLSLPKARVYALAREGQIGGVVKIGSQVRFEPQALDAWIRGGGASGHE